MTSTAPVRCGPATVVAASVALGASLSAQVVSESAEPNDTPAAGIALPCGSEGAGQLGLGDVDCWAFTIPAVADISVFATARGAHGVSTGGTSAEDVVVVLLDVDGTTVLQRQEVYAARPIQQTGLFPRVVESALPAGTYYLLVSGWSAFDVGDYALDVVCSAPRPSPFCERSSIGADELEPNDSSADFGVRAADCCDETTGSILVAQDRDFWRLELTEPSRVAWRVTRPTGSVTPLYDAILEVYAADGSTLIDRDDDSGPGTDPYLEIDLQPATYFVAVRGFSIQVGDYVMVTDCAPLGAIPAMADFAEYGDSTTCLGSTGEPLRIVPRRNEWPLAGGTFSFDIDGVVGGVVVLLGVEPYAPVIDLGLLGAPGCGLATVPRVDALPASPSVPGEAALSLAVPFWVRPGAVVHLQAASVDRGANALDLTLSNRLQITLCVDA